MSVIGLAIIFLIAAGLRWIRWVRTSRVLFVFVAVLFLAIGCGVLPSWLMGRLQAGLSGKVPEIRGSGAVVIVVLGGGTDIDPIDNVLRVPAVVTSRVTAALKIYRACLNHGNECSVLVTGGNPQKHGVAEAPVYGRELIDLGVDPKDLILESRSFNTWQNAQFTAAILAKRRVGQVFLVTSGFHLSRGVLYFAHFGVHATPMRSDFVTGRLSLVPQGMNFLVMDLAIHEYLGIARYYVYEALGWNVTAQGKGAL